MSITLTSPVTGGPQTNFATPTYTHAADQAPDSTQKQWAVSVAGGTQVGVSVHSASAPFTFTAQRPKVFKYLGKPNPTTGVIKDVPMNTWKFRVRKGVLPLAGQPMVVSDMTILWNIPAGSDLASPAELRGMCSMMIGSLWQISSQIGDSVINGTL
jgi:hypothetical protein